MSKQWLSVHIFHTGDLNALLVEAIAPAVNELVQTGLQQWFFVRYWNGGPHIRLRLRCPENVSMDTLLTPVYQAVADFTKRHPSPAQNGDVRRKSQRRIANFAGLERMLARGTGIQVEAPEPVQPNGSVQLRQFSFDERRYGGVELEPISLNHFHWSSRLALEVVRATLHRPAARFTLALHVAAATAMSIKKWKREPNAIFTRMGEQLYHFADGEGSDEASRAGFDPFAKVLPLLGDLLDQLSTGLPIPGQTEFMNSLLEAWSDEIANARSLVMSLCRSAELTETSNIDGLSIDYLHMFVNRLGIPLREEFYMYYLLSRALAITRPESSRRNFPDQP